MKLFNFMVVFESISVLLAVRTKATWSGSFGHSNFELVIIFKHCITTWKVPKRSMTSLSTVRGTERFTERQATS